jgi:hypothetical protein
MLIALLEKRGYSVDRGDKDLDSGRAGGEARREGETARRTGDHPWLRRRAASPTYPARV